VTRFLTPEWLDALAAAAAEVEPPAGLAPDARLVLGQEVRDTPAGDVRYQIVVEAAGLRVVAPPAEPADLTFVCDLVTAVALARGEVNAQQALMAGGLRLRGDVERFAAAREALLALGDVFARVRDATTF
jgi:putative sterol carrier protein